METSPWSLYEPVGTSVLSGLMSVVSSASGKIDSVHGDDTLEHRENDRFLETKFLLATADGPHLRFYTGKLITFTQPSTEWAWQANQIALFTAFSSKSLAYHDRLRLSIFANVLSALVLGDLSSTAIITLLMQYSKNSGLS